MPFVPCAVAVRDVADLGRLHFHLNGYIPGSLTALAFAAAARSCPPDVRYVSVVYDERLPARIAEFRDNRSSTHRIALTDR